MKIKYIGSEKDVKKYRESVVEQEEYLRQNSKFINYKEKSEGFRLIQGELKVKAEPGKQSDRPVSGLVPDEKLYIDGIANANVQDRMYEIVNPQGCDVRNYVKNSILLADHMYMSSHAIGVVEELRVESDGVKFTAYIGDPKAAKLTEKQVEIRSLVAQGILRTVSIGFIPKEIIVPEWDEKTGEMISPAKIEKWEMLELSIVPIPCNQDSVFDIKSLTKSHTLTENKTKAETSSVQSLVFSKSDFTVKGAKEWAEKHDYRSDKLDETEETILLSQKDSGEFEEGSFKTIELTDGVKAVTGRLKGKDAMEEKTAQELVKSIKDMGTLLQTLNATSQRSVELTENILKRFEEKKVDPATTDDEEEDGCTCEGETCGCGKPKKPKKSTEGEPEPTTETTPEPTTTTDETEKKFKTLDEKIERLAGLMKILAERISE
jgi:phage head maturation protease